MSVEQQKNKVLMLPTLDGDAGSSESTDFGVEWLRGKRSWISCLDWKQQVLMMRAKGEACHTLQNEQMIK
jgi:hypothetical protein